MNKLMVINKENKKAKAVVIATGVALVIAGIAVALTWVNGVHDAIAINEFVGKVNGAVASIKL